MKALIWLPVAALLSTPVFASQDVGQLNREGYGKLYPGQVYSPYAKGNFPNEVYWGETHVHTGLSFDAGLFGNTTGPDTAYRLARGEEVVSSTGQPVKLSRPLDWLVVTDHSDLMGLAIGIQEGSPTVMAEDKGRSWHEGFKKGGVEAGKAALDLVGSFTQGTLPESIEAAYTPGSETYTSIWEQVIDAAEQHNTPGRFTAFIGYEWTSTDKGFNLHRNVVLRDGGDRARQVIPYTTQAPVGSHDPLDLYKWLGDYESQTGGKAFALAHNGNLSNGWMFPIDKTYTGGEVNKEYVTLRAKWEPLYEVTQIKGDGEAHPKLSPEDEFADYESWDVANLDLSQLKEDSMLAGEYAREALKRGLKLEEKFGVNPYKFGMVGATDSHTSMATAEEDNFFGKATSSEPSKERANRPFVKNALGTIEGDQLTASGYQGIWATENTREALWDAMARKETYATTGPRMTVRFFGGWAFNDDDLRSRSPAFRGYEKGVPMGGDITAAPKGKSPTFMVYALRDPIGANLDRIQIVKGWLADDGITREQVYDVAWSGDRKINGKGKLPSVGNTVDVNAATWTNTIGQSELATVWTDPDFDPNECAFYYVRVLEIPTPRWVLYDRLRFGTELREKAVQTHQERGYTSPIWYSPPAKAGGG